MAKSGAARVGNCQIDVRQKDVLPSCTGKASLIEGNLHTQPGFAARSSCARTCVAWHSMHLAALEVVANRQPLKWALRASSRWQGPAEEVLGHALFETQD